MKSQERLHSRRDALAAVGSTVLGMAAAGTLGATKSSAGSDEALDEALRILQREEPQSRQGLSTHAPMVAETLCALGAGENAVPWVKGYNAPVRQLPGRSARIDPDHWRAALGPKLGVASWEDTNARWADWKDFFEREIENNPWREVLDRWVGRLAPGMSGAATHGVIRTAHAVRSLARRDTTERRGELARGLAYWASSYEELPVQSSAKPGAESFADALMEAPLYWEAFGKSPEGRNIVEDLRGVRDLVGFAKVRDMVARTNDLSGSLSALTATFARVYLRHGTKHDTIAFVHAVTGPCALRRMAPFVTAKTALDALPFAWQTAAAIYSAYSRDHALGRAEESKLSAEELVARAVKSGDEHAIKFTEVMVSEHAIRPDPIYLAAAEDAIQRL